ncbi:MAG: protein translocase subunit SecF [Candidatus Margulisiibacteriota bacterium]|nr:protein translocase subunit SecF [Candidatus Margulisiibacteriota bacterium]
MNIIGRRKLWFTISSALIAISIGAFVYNTLVHGEVMNFGIDFTGGTMINLRFEKWIPLDEVRGVLDGFGLGGDKSVIQRSGEKDVFIRTQPLESDTRIEIVNGLKEKFGTVDLLESDTIGPVIGKELRTHAIWALIIASAGILIYVTFRFESYKYAAAALVALLHDAIITTGVMALFWRTIDVAFIAGILTIMGYSINDTIVIFDRVRENLRKPGASKHHFATIVNTSLLETVARSLNTVFTSLIMVLALLFFGGATLKNFCLVLVVGFAIGTYSSMFLAAPLLVVWEKRKHK